jgi:hypothetical protein
MRAGVGSQFGVIHPGILPPHADPTSRVAVAMGAWGQGQLSLPRPCGGWVVAHAVGPRHAHAQVGAMPPRGRLPEEADHARTCARHRRMAAAGSAAGPGGQLLASTVSASWALVLTEAMPPRQLALVV